MVGLLLKPLVQANLDLVTLVLVTILDLVTIFPNPTRLLSKIKVFSHLFNWQILDLVTTFS